MTQIYEIIWHKLNHCSVSLVQFYARNSSQFTMNTSQSTAIKTAYVFTVTDKNNKTTIKLSYMQTEETVPEFKNLKLNSHQIHQFQQKSHFLHANEGNQILQFS